MSLARDIADLGSVTARLDTVGGSSGALSNRNLIINGGMQCWQRATATTISGSGSYKTVDRFQIYEATNGVFTTEQSTGNAADTGHDTALQCNVTTIDSSIGAGQYAAIVHRIEAQNLQHLQWGTAAGKNLVLSFWVKSNKTGIYSLSTEKNDSTAYRRVNEFTINSANTWEQKTIKIPALTNSNSGGTIANDNGLGIKFEWCLAYGSTFTTTSLDQWITSSHFASTNQVNWMDSTSNNFYLTGIQLELGDFITPFEHRSFAQEFELCQRYFSKSYAYGTAIGATTSHGSIQTTFHENNQGSGYRENYGFKFPVQMRATPTIVIYDTAGTSGKCNYYIGTSSSPARTLNVSSINATSFGGYSDRATTMGGWACQYTADAEL